MKNLLFVFLIGLCHLVNAQENENALIQKGYYYNQSLPADSAVVFAPGIFSLPDRLESNIVYSSDGKECYFGVMEIKDNKALYKIYHSTYVNNKWTEQLEAPFSLNNNSSDPFLSADGKKIYFERNSNIWMVERTLEGWGEPQLLPSPINSDSYDGSYIENAEGVAYISSKRPGGFGGMDIWRINSLTDESLQAENLGPKLNTELFDYSPFLAPDESYLIFGSYRKGKHGQADLFISFNKGNDEWMTPINMNSCGAKINNNTAHHSNVSLSHDGKFLFFRRHETMMEMDIYWVSVEVIDKLKEKAMQQASSLNFTNLKGEYLGQTPPGDSAIIFAPGIVSVDSTIEHGSPTFSPDGNEVFWQSNYRQSGKKTQIFGMTMKRIGNEWTAPKISPYDSDPVFSHDGKRLYFLPFGEENGEKDGPHYVEKEGNNWSQPVCMELIKRFPEIKTVYNHSFTKSGTLYFLGYAEGCWNNFGIYRSEFINGVYAQPELLPDSINILGNIRNWTPFIAPDESYLLFSSSRRSPQTDAGDIYISFRNSEGSWTTPVILDDKINSDRQERFPSVSPDGKYLFFTRWVSPGNEDVMWVSSKIIDDIKKEIFN